MWLRNAPINVNYQLLSFAVCTPWIKPQGGVGRGGLPTGNWLGDLFPGLGFWHLGAALGSGIWHGHHLERPKQPGNESPPFWSFCFSRPTKSERKVSESVLFSFKYTQSNSSLTQWFTSTLTVFVFFCFSWLRMCSNSWACLILAT